MVNSRSERERQGSASGWWRLKSPKNQVRVRKKRQQPLGQNGAVGRIICAKKVNLGGPKGAVGGSKQAFRGENINRKDV